MPTGYMDQMSCQAHVCPVNNTGTLPSSHRTLQDDAVERGS